MQSEIEQKLYLDFAFQMRGVANRITKLEAMAGDNRITNPYYAPMTWIKTYVDMLMEKVEANMPDVN